MGAITGGVTAIATAIVAGVMLPATLTTLQAVTVLASIATAGLSGFGSVLTLSTVAARPLRRCADDLRDECWAIAQGDSPRALPTPGQPELQALVHQFNQIAPHLHQRRQQQTAAQSDRSENNAQQAVPLLHLLCNGRYGDRPELQAGDGQWGEMTHHLQQLLVDQEQVLQRIHQLVSVAEAESLPHLDDVRSLYQQAEKNTTAVAQFLASWETLQQKVSQWLGLAQEFEQLTDSTPGAATKSYSAVEQALTGYGQIQTFLSEATQNVNQVAEAGQGINHLALWSNELNSDLQQLVDHLRDQSKELRKAMPSGYRWLKTELDELNIMAREAQSLSANLQKVVLQELNVAAIAMNQVSEETVAMDSSTQTSQVLSHLEDIIQVNNRWHSLPNSITTDLADMQSTVQAIAPALQTTHDHTQTQTQQLYKFLVDLSELQSPITTLRAIAHRYPTAPLEKSAIAPKSADLQADLQKDNNDGSNVNLDEDFEEFDLNEAFNPEEFNLDDDSSNAAPMPMVDPDVDNSDDLDFEDFDFTSQAFELDSEELRLDGID